MPQKKISWIYVALGGAILIVIGLATWWYLQKGSIPATPNDVSEAVAQLLASGATSTRGNGFTVEVEPVVGTPPSLDRAVPATPEFSAEARALLITKINASIAALKKNSTSFSDWMDLGTERQAATDYEGAREAFAYASVLSPQSATPFGNLGYLFMAYLKDYAKAEENYKKARANDPKNPLWYRSLIDMYLAEHSASAEVSLKDAIAAFPTSLDFHVLLARWYRDQGKAEEARAEYDVAITTAQKQGNTAAATQLKAEKAAVQ